MSVTMHLGHCYGAALDLLHDLPRKGICRTTVLRHENRFGDARHNVARNGVLNAPMVQARAGQSIHIDQFSQRAHCLSPHLSGSRHKLGAAIEVINCPIAVALLRALMEDA